MKKISIYLLLTTFVLSLLPYESAYAKSSFHDVNRYEEFIDYLYNNNIIQGYEDSTFKPQDNLKRIQGVQMILNALEIPLGDAPDPGFDDINPGDYGYHYIAKAAELDIISGFSDGTFKSWETLKRGQMASILTNAFELSGYDSYSLKSVPEYLDPAVAALRANGIAKGYPDHTFGSFEKISREHFSVFLSKTINDSMKSSPDLQAEFLDVGQGDSILIIFPNQTTMLVDGGEYGNKVVTDLKNIGISHIDTLVSTHPDADHIGGLDKVIQNFSIGEFVNSGQASETQTYNQLYELIEQKSIPVVTPKVGDDISTDNKVNVTVLNNDATAVSSEKNDASLVLNVAYGEQDLLLTGDISSEVEQYLINQYNLEAEILKVAHHGSNYSSSSGFLNEVQTDASVLSYGDNNYGHPGSNVINRLNNIGSDIYSTDELGNILFNVTSNSSNPYWVNTDPSSSTDEQTEQPTTEPEEPANEVDLKYDPNGPDRDCGDFDTHDEAQNFYEAAGGPESDPHRLDGSDQDGVACESLP